MRMQNSRTGAVIEIPPPDSVGRSVVLLNGKVIERVRYSDVEATAVTLESGKSFRTGDAFAAYLIDVLAAATPDPVRSEDEPLDVPGGKQ